MTAGRREKMLPAATIRRRRAVVAAEARYDRLIG